MLKKLLEFTKGWLNPQFVPSWGRRLAKIEWTQGGGWAIYKDGKPVRASTLYLLRCALFEDGANPFYLGGSIRSHWAIKEPVQYKIGAGSHNGEVWSYVPTMRKIWWEVTSWICVNWFPVDTTQLEDTSASLWGEWWYQSNRIDFGWIGWTIAAKRALKRRPCCRSEAREHIVS